MRGRPADVMVMVVRKDAKRSPSSSRCPRRDPREERPACRRTRLRPGSACAIPGAYRREPGHGDHDLYKQGDMKGLVLDLACTRAGCSTPPWGSRPPSCRRRAGRLQKRPDVGMHRYASQQTEEVVSAPRQRLLHNSLPVSQSRRRSRWCVLVEQAARPRRAGIVAGALQDQRRRDGDQVRRRSAKGPCRRSCRSATRQSSSPRRVITRPTAVRSRPRA